MSVFRVLKCIGQAVKRNSLKCLVRMLPMGESLYDIASDAVAAYQEKGESGELAGDVAQLAQASPEEIAEAAEKKMPTPEEWREYK